MRHIAHAAELVEWEVVRVIAKDTKGMKMPKKLLLALGDLLKAKKKPSANADPEEVEPGRSEQHQQENIQRDFESGVEEDLSSEGEENDE